MVNFHQLQHSPHARRARLRLRPHHRQLDRGPCPPSPHRRRDGHRSCPVGRIKLKINCKKPRAINSLNELNGL
jgi:hypothetical protein